MERVDIKLGFYCNNLCKFCVQGRKRDVVFTGGEPSLHPNFLELVKLARGIGFEQIQIQSNGRMFAYLNFCIKAIKAGASQFSPALHGSTSEIHDFLVGAEGGFNQTIKGIRNLKKLDQYVLTNTVITSKNYKDLPNLAELLVDLDVDQFQFSFVHILGTADQNKDWIVPRKTEIMPYVKDGLDIGMRAGKRVTTEAIPYCFMHGYENNVVESVMPETRIYDAGFVVEDYKDYRVNSGKGKIKRKECRKCKYFDICEGPWIEYPNIYGWDEFKPID